MKGSMRRKAMAKLNRIRPEEFASQICDVYVSGISTRKVKKSLKSATGAKIKLSKSTVSRITKKLVTEFQEWKKKDSSKLGVAYLFFDAIRVGKRSGLFSFNLSSL
jgi:transposase-like protein